jgi:hypothetical protein
MKKYPIIFVAILLFASTLAYASRDGSGNYTLPVGINPVLQNTAIKASWANTTLQDIEREITWSLDRRGGYMTGPLQLASGSTSVPGATFYGAQNSGFYLKATSPTVIGLATGGVDRQTWTATNTLISVPVIVNGNFDVTSSGLNVISGTNALVNTIATAGGIRAAGSITAASNVVFVNGAISTTMNGPASGGNYLLTLPTAVPTAATVGATAWASGNVILYDMVTADTGKVYVCTKSGTTTVAPSGTGMAQAPGGVATWDYYAPDVSAPVVMSTTGSLSASRLSNSHQNFGAPVEQRDVVTKDYFEANSFGRFAGPATTVCLSADSATVAGTGAPYVWLDSGLSVTLAASAKYQISFIGELRGTSGSGTINSHAAYAGTAYTTFVTSITELAGAFVDPTSATGVGGATIAGLASHPVSWSGIFRTTGTGGVFKVQHGVSGATGVGLMESGSCLSVTKLL